MKSISIISKDKYLEEALRTSGEVGKFDITTGLKPQEAYINIKDSKEFIDIKIGQAIKKLMKPIRLMELIAIIKDTAINRVFYFNGCHFDPKSRRIGKETKVEQLTEKETQILRMLCEADGIAITSEKLLSEVFGYDSRVETNTIETHIYRLRQKLKNIAGEEVIITSNDGYVITV